MKKKVPAKLAKFFKRKFIRLSRNIALKKTYIENKTVLESSLFKNKVVVVTGGASGIGEAIARKLINSGAQVVICSRDIEKLTDTSNKISSKNLDYQKCDITNSSDVSKLIEYIEKKYKKIDVLINAAAIFSGTQFEDVTEKEWDEIYSVNSRAVFFLFQNFLNNWTNEKHRKTKKIVNISSQAAQIGATYPYRLTKWDVTGLTEGLAKKYAKENILINSVAPGIILTNMQKQLMTIDGNYMNSNVPLQRSGTTSEIAELVCFIASDRCNFLTGQTIYCDGGYSLR